MLKGLRRWAAISPLLVAAFQPAAAAGPDDAVRTLTDAYNATGQQLYRDFARTPGNIVLSPFSIGTALTMARSGARGETERQMASALNERQSREEADAANAAVMAILDGYDRTSRPDYCPRGTRFTGRRCEGQPTGDRKCPLPTRLDRDLCVGEPLAPSARLVMANALMLARRGDLIGKDYRTLVREKYRAEIHEGAGVDDVNAWVKRKTEGKIERIIDRLDPDTAAVLLNAVYFKAAWAATFVASATRPDDFSLSPGQKVRVSMMRQQDSFALIERPSYRAIRLDYSERALRMVIVLPNDVDGLDTVAGALDQKELAGVFAALRTQPSRLVALALPRFKTTFDAELVAPFQQAGMRLAFSDDADFSGMTGRRPSEAGVKIGGIKHRAVIEVTESGTEAAAVTAVVMVPTRAMGPRERPTPIPFIVDHPFLFYVIDDATGAILFQGHVRNPNRQ